MSERINTPFTNEHFADWCQKMVGQPYWYGTCVYKATNSLLSRKSNQYPSSYASSRMSRYKQDIANKAVVSDCIGGCKGYAWTNGGQGVLEAIGTDKTITSKYGSNGCPDKGANSMFSWAKKKGMDWGTIDTLPEIPGLALYKDGHAGYYIGNGYAVEWQGFSWGCVKTQVKKRPWTHWYKLPFIDYGDTSGAQVAVEAVTVYTLGSRLLKNGSSGADVKALQELLNQLGAALTVDGWSNVQILLFQISLYVHNNGYLVLPILAGVSQVVTSKLTTQQTAGAAQQASQQQSTTKFMQIFFPILSVYFCLTSNAGFAIYWVASNLIMGAQSVLINKYLEKQDEKKKASVAGEGSVK